MPTRTRAASLQALSAMPLLAALVGCGEGGSGGPPEDASEDAAEDLRSDAQGLARPTSPVFTPCPAGWEPVTDWGLEITTCEPWPDGGPVVLTPCPEGWREVADEALGVATCDPWPEGGPAVLTPCPTGWTEVLEGSLGLATCEPWSRRAECADDEVQLPGEASCTRIGTACPEGDWPEGLPASGVLYVRSGAVGGAGTPEAPYGAIAEAIDVASEGDVIALGRGTFAETVVLTSVGVWGACVAETHVTAVHVEGTGATLRNVRVGGAGIGIAIPAGSGLAVEDVVIAEAVGHGLVARGALEASRLVVRGTRADEGGLGGVGLLAENGAQVVIAGGLIDGSREAGLLARGAGTIVRLTDFAVGDTEGRVFDGENGRGIMVEEGATLEIERSVSSGNRRTSLYVAGSGTTLRAKDIVVRETRGQASDQRGGNGIAVLQGASALVERVLVMGNHNSGIFVSDSETVASLSDVVVLDTRADASGEPGGEGLRAQLGGSVAIGRGVFARNEGRAVIATSSGTHLVLQDVSLRDTHSTADGFGGEGLFVANGASVEATRALLSANRSGGVRAFDPVTRVTLEDVVVRDTQSEEARGTWGIGLWCEDGATIAMHRGLLERNRGSGAFARYEGSTLALSDVIVRDTLGQAGDRDMGDGLVVSDGADLTLERGLLLRNRDAGVLASDRGTTVALVDVVIRDTEGQEVDGLGGAGAWIDAGASLSVSRGLLASNRRVGLLATGARTAITLADVVVRETRAQGDASDLGLGVWVATGASLTASRLLLAANRDQGLFATDGGTTLSLEDIVVTDTRSSQTGGVFGNGLLAQSGATVDVERSLLTANRELAVAAFDRGTVVRLIDSTVTATLERACVLDDCVGQGGGTAVGAFGGSTVEMERFLLADNAQCGAMVAHGADASGVPLAEGGVVWLTDGEVTRNRVCGLNVQSDGFDLHDHVVRVRAHDNNGNDVDTGELLVPRTSDLTPE